MAKEPNDYVPIGRNWLISTSGREKLGVALLSSCIAIIAYSFLELWRVQKSQAELALRLTEETHIHQAFNQETPHLDTTNAIIESGSQRILALKTVNFGKEVKLPKNQLDSWRSTISKMRAVIRYDRGRVDQFNSDTYPNLKDSAKAIATLLDEEDEMWTALQQFLESQANSAATAEDSENHFQSFINKLLAHHQSLGSYQGALHRSLDALETKKRETSLRFERLLSESQSNRHTFNVFCGLLVVGAIGSVVCTAGIVGLARKKPAPSKILTDLTKM